MRSPFPGVSTLNQTRGVPSLAGMPPPPPASRQLPTTVLRVTDSAEDPTSAMAAGLASLGGGSAAVCTGRAGAAGSGSSRAVLEAGVPAQPASRSAVKATPAPILMVGLL